MEANADLQLINVQEPIAARETMFRGTYADLKEIQAERERTGREILRAAEDRLHDAAVQWAAHVHIGEAPRVIAEHFAKFHCTEVMMGTRGMGLTGNLVLGSVASRTIHLVDAPITLVKGPCATGAAVRRLLIAIDGSPGSRRAAEYAIGLMKRRGPLELTALNVQPPIESGGVRRFISSETIDAFHQAEGTAALADVETLLQQAGCRFESLIHVGHAAQVIADAAQARGCDAIVMGTRGMSAFGSWALGSIATKVIHLATVPVTLVK